MPLMRAYTEIIVEEGLLPQIVRELTEMAIDQNHVEVTHGVTGRVILVHPELAEAWYQKAVAKNKADDAASDDAETSDADDADEASPESKVAESKTSESTTSERAASEPATSEPAASSEPEPRAAADIAARELSFPVPVKRGPGRPRKYPPAPSVSNGEES